MRYLLLLLPLAAVGCADAYGPDYAAGPGYTYNPPAYAAQPSYSPPAYASGYGYGAPAPMPPRSYGGENCGTPDQPLACPPLPRHPLPYYPANRE